MIFEKSYFNLYFFVGFFLVFLIILNSINVIQWNFLDFLVFGGMLLGTIFLINLVRRKVKKENYKLLIILILLISFLLVWAEFGVGLFGSLFAGN